MVRESVAPGAFAGIERRAEPGQGEPRPQARADRRQSRRVLPDPRRRAGRRAENLGHRARRRNPDAGRRRLPGCLAPAICRWPDGENWLTRTAVRMTKCWLGHVALTPDPAYAGARCFRSVRRRMMSRHRGICGADAEPGCGPVLADGRTVRTAPPECLTRTRNSCRHPSSRRHRRRTRCAGSLTPGVEYTFTSAAGYGFTAVYNKTQPGRLPERENQGRHRRVRQPDRDRRRRPRRRLGPGVTSGAGLVDSRLVRCSFLPL